MTLNQLGLYNPENLPAIVERKGTLYLRSDHMKYGKGTRNSEWHFEREAEPKDYDISNPEDGKRNLLRTTYARIGNDPQASFSTTAHESMKEIELLKDDYPERTVRKPLIGQTNFNTTAMKEMSSITECSDYLPHHSKEHNKHHLQTTQRIDYKPPYNQTMEADQQQTTMTTIDQTVHKNRRNISEFTDTDNHRRPGFRVWQDTQLSSTG